MPMRPHTRTRPYADWLALSLAHALLADAEPANARQAPALLARMSACLGESPAWLTPLANALAQLSTPTWQRHTVYSLATALQKMLGLSNTNDMDELDDLDELGEASECDGLVGLNAFSALDSRPTVRRLILRPARMGLPPLHLNIPPLPDLATFASIAEWLQMDPERLAWLTSPAQHYRDNPYPSNRPRPQAAQHYRYLLRAKRSGGLRLLETPKPDLKRIQRQLLHQLLGHIPVHEAAHGFVPGRGTASHAAAHSGQASVIAFDLRDFFPSIGAARVRALWRSLGYPEGSADTLTTLCTTRTPTPVRERLQEAGLHRIAAQRLASPHLAQGAPTSPVLANLCAFHLDLRLDGLAYAFGARYTRYADDLVFSGPAALHTQWRKLHAWVAQIALDEGFALHPGKTRTMPQHQRQRVTGIIVNQHPNLPREDYDQLRAELHQHGTQPATAPTPELRAHLQGRIAWAQQFLCPARVQKLQRLLDRIGFDELRGR